MVADLHGRVALVTGGGIGFGRVVSGKLAAAGAHIVLCYPNAADEAEALAAAEELRTMGVRVLARRADVACADEMEALIAAVEAEFGRLDLLVNNAGCTIFVDFQQLDEIAEADWDRIMAVNVKGAFLCSRAAAPLLRASGAGRIVNVTSISGLKPGGSSIPYSVSKAAETMLTRCLAIALAPEITVNAVAPGFMATRWGMRFGPDAVARSAASVPLRKIPSLDEIADAVLFLATNGSMTGQTIVVDCGALTR